MLSLYTMKIRKLFRKFTSAALVSAVLMPVALFAQTAISAPRQEKLLNGLKILMWSDPKADNISVKLRIHAGSAFDPQGREGVMQLTADNFFPNDGAREFFAEDLGGSLDIVTTYDYIQINASAKAGQGSLVKMLEALSSAVANPVIDKETTAKLRTGLLEKLTAKESDAAYIADRSVAKRLFGTFPYGRPQMGTNESLKKIEFPDLIDAKLRFLTADNATMTITGNFVPGPALTAAQRLFGPWLKSDKRVPNTFRQPETPDAKSVEIAIADNGNSEFRYSVRGLTRNDNDFAAAGVFTEILAARLQNLVSKEPGTKAFATHEAHIQPGVINFGYSSPTSFRLPSNAISILFSSVFTDAEFNEAKAKSLARINQTNNADRWLDVDTFKITSAAAELQNFSNVSVSDVRRVAERLAKNPVVSVSVIPKPTTSAN